MPVDRRAIMGHNAHVMRIRVAQRAPKHMVWCVLWALLAIAAPCHAWLYDSGIANLAGPILKDGSGIEWAAGIFKLTADSYGTSFGAAVSRAYGPPDAGFTLSLATWSWTDYRPGPTIDQWTITPAIGSLKYYYGTAASPILLSATQYYCLVVAPNDPAFAGPISYTLKYGLYYGWGTSDHGASWARLMLPVCIQVDGYVPEPGSLWALLAGCLAIAFPRLRLRSESYRV